MSYTPTSGVAKDIDAARGMLAACATWRTLTGTASAALAKAYTYPISAPGTTARPKAIVYNVGSTAVRTSLNSWRFEGNIAIILEVDISATYRTDEGGLWWVDQVSKIRAELMAQNPPTSTQLPLRSIAMTVDRNDPTLTNVRGDFGIAMLTLETGI